jgi:glycosyltransferase 2 family protein
MRRALHASIGIVLVLCVALAITTTLDRFPDLNWRFSPGWLVLAVVAFALHVLASAEIWRRLLGALGPRLGAKPAAAIWCASALGRYVPTGLLLPLMRTAMAEREGVPKRICIASIVYEVALAFTAAVLLGAYFVIELPDLQGEPERFSILIVPILALVGLYPGIFHPLADSALRRLGRETLPVSLPLRRVVEFIFLYGISLVIAGLGLYALAESIYQVGGGDVVTVVGAYAAATALSLIAFMLPGGLVAREAAITVALAPVLPTAPAIAVAVLARVLQIAIEVILTAVTTLAARQSSIRQGAAVPTPRAPGSQVPSVR